MSFCKFRRRLTPPPHPLFPPTESGRSAYFELKDKDANDMSTCIRKLQDMSRNRRFWLSEVEKIVKVYFYFY